MINSPQPPDFVREKGGADAVAEFRKFATAIGEPAAHVLAELALLHNHGTQSDIPAEDNAATTVRGLYCRKIDNWAIFYTASQPWKITVLHIGHVNPHSFNSLESEATRRLRRLKA